MEQKGHMTTKELHNKVRIALQTVAARGATHGATIGIVYKALNDSSIHIDTVKRALHDMLAEKEAEVRHGLWLYVERRQTASTHRDRKTA